MSKTKTKIHVVVHSDVYELIWFKRRMTIDTIDQYILILVYVTYTLIQGHSNWQN